MRQITERRSVWACVIAMLPDTREGRSIAHMIRSDLKLNKSHRAMTIDSEETVWLPDAVSDRVERLTREMRGSRCRHMDTKGP